MELHWIKYGFFAALLLICLRGGMALQAEAKEKAVTEHDLVLSLEKMGEETAKQAGLREMISGKKQKATRERAAYLIWQYLKAKEETKINQELLRVVIERRRLSDYGKIKKAYQEAAASLYTEGIMEGNSNGSFSSSRSFHPKDFITQKEWSAIEQRLRDPKKRRKLSPDGQLLRTGNLPKNYKKFPYILASYKNAYYEHTFDYERIVSKKVVEGKDYTNPAKVSQETMGSSPEVTYPVRTVMDLYLDDWVRKVKDNVNLRFNVDYRTIDKNSSWVHRLRNTYYVFGNDPEYDMIRTKDIKSYVSRMKKNRVVIQGQTAVDRSSLYLSNGIFYLRAYVKFKVLSADSMEDLSKVFYADHVFIRDLAKGKWMERYFDIAVGTSVFNSVGDDYAVMFDSLLDSLKR